MFSLSPNLLVLCATTSSIKLLSTPSTHEPMMICRRYIFFTLSLIFNYFPFLSFFYVFITPLQLSILTFHVSQLYVAMLSCCCILFYFQNILLFFGFLLFLFFLWSILVGFKYGFIFFPMCSHFVLLHQCIYSFFT